MRVAGFTGVALVVLVSGCGPGTPPIIAPAPKPANAHEVVIFNYDYNPSTLTVPVGTMVTWVNRDIAPHTVTYRSYGEDGFDSDKMLHDQQFFHKFRTVGTFDYICTLHQGMQATVVVKDTVAP